MKTTIITASSTSPSAAIWKKSRTLFLYSLLFSSLCPPSLLAIEPVSPSAVGSPPQLKEINPADQTPLPFPQPKPNKQPNEPLEFQPQQNTAWLGVMTFAVDELTTAQLGIEDGVAVQVVTQGSPAANAGLQVHDIITTFDGQSVPDHLSLRRMIQGKKVGSPIEIEVISRGQKKTIKTTLESRPQGRSRIRRVPSHPHSTTPPIPSIDPRTAPRPSPLTDDPLSQLLPMFQGFDERLMQQHLEELRQQFQHMQHSDGSFFNEPLLQELLGQIEKRNPQPQLLPNGKGKAPSSRPADMGQHLMELMRQSTSPLGENISDLSTSSNVRIQDDKGIIEMKSSNGHKEVTIKDQDGRILYAGPYNTKQDIAEVPAELRKRVERLNFQGNRGLSLRLGCPSKSE